MSKSLKILQGVAKVGKILSTVSFVLFLLLAVCLLIGVSTLATIQGVQVEGQTVVAIVENTGTNFVTLIFTCTAMLLHCIAGATLAKLAEVHFINELEIGTPFTKEGSKELFRLGILILAIPLTVNTIVKIAFAITKHFYPALVDMLPGISFSLSAGVLVILISCLCRYGAELTDKLQSNSDNK